MIYNEVAIDEIADQEILLKRSEDLIKNHPFTFWLLEWKFLVESYREVHEAETSTIVLNEYQKEGRVSEIVEKTAARFFDEENRLNFKRRLEEAAYILWKIGKEEDAKCALAAALAFAPEGVPSSAHPFALKTVRENFNFLKEQAQKEKRSESGRIVLP
jgi:hypothetical protein